MMEFAEKLGEIIESTDKVTFNVLWSHRVMVQFKFKKCRHLQKITYFSGRNKGLMSYYNLKYPDAGAIKVYIREGERVTIYSRT